MKCKICGKRAGLLVDWCDDCTKEYWARKRQEEREQAPKPPQLLDSAMVTTNAELPGYVTISNLGIVRGISVRSRSAIGNAIAGAEALVGGQISTYEKLCEETREIAFLHLRQHATAIGADGVTGMQFDAAEISAGITEVLCYGSAVKLIPVRTFENSASESCRETTAT